MGYEIHHSKIKRSHVVIAVIAAILFDGVRFLGTIYYSTTQGELSRVFYGYVTLFALIPAVAIFSLCKVVRWDNIFSESQKVVLSRISSCSFGVYLIHLIIMRVYAKLFRQSLISLGFRTYGVIVVYVACVVIVYAIKKIPIVKNIVP